MRLANRFGFGYPKPSGTQVFTTSAVSQASTALNTQTTMIRVATTQAVRMEIGPNDGTTTPTASAASSLLIPQDTVEYFSVHGGEKVAFIQDTAAGTCTLTEMTA